MFHVFAALIGLYVIGRFVPPLPVGTLWKWLIAFVILLVSQYHLVNRLFLGGMAYPPGRTDSDRDVRHRADTGMGQTDRRDSHRGYCPVSGRHQALARSQTGQCHDTYGHYRRRSWQKRRMA